jgi:hypothetical protein
MLWIEDQDLLTVFVVQCSLNVIYSGIWHSAAFEKLKPLLRGLCFCDLFNHTIELDAIFDAVAIRHETIVCFPLGMPESVTENAEKSIVAAAEENVAVEGLVASIRNN